MRCQIDWARNVTYVLRCGNANSLDQPLTLPIVRIVCYCVSYLQRLCRHFPLAFRYLLLVAHCSARLSLFDFSRMPLYRTERSFWRWPHYYPYYYFFSHNKQNNNANNHFCFSIMSLHWSVLTSRMNWLRFHDSRVYGLIRLPWNWQFAMPNYRIRAYPSLATQMIRRDSLILHWPHMLID